MSSAVTLFDVTTRPYCLLFATIGHILISLLTKPTTALKAKARAKLLIFFYTKFKKIDVNFATNTTF